MIDWNWITTSWSSLLMVVISALGIYSFLLLCVRVAGLRSFAKMSSFDFATTIATGSILAATLLTKDTPLLQGMVGLAAVFVAQYVVSWLRRHTSFMPVLVDNEPLLLMAGPDILEENLGTARLTTNDLYAHLRQAGIIHPKEVLAVVLETTGDISVLKKGQSDYNLDPDLLADVRQADMLPSMYLVQSGADS